MNNTIDRDDFSSRNLIVDDIREFDLSLTTQSPTTTVGKIRVVAIPGPIGMKIVSRT